MPGFFSVLAHGWTADLRSEAWAPDDPRWYSNNPRGPIAASGQHVDAESAQRVSAFYRGLNLLSNDIAKPPFEVYERLSGNKGRRRAFDNPLYTILNRFPNVWQTSFEWRRQGMRHLVLRGNWYNRIISGRRGFVDQLVPLHPDLVTPKQIESGRIVYFVKNIRTGQTDAVSQDEIFHVRGVSDDGVTGKSVLTWARDSLGIALATESYAGKLFSQGSLHGPRITIPGGLAPEQEKALIAAYRTSQENWHNPFVLLNGATLADPELTPEDSQFLLSRQFSVTEMARWLGVAPHKLADLSRSTNNNIEQQSLEYRSDLSNWSVPIDQAVLRDLILNPDRFFAEIDLDATVAIDSVSRADLLSKMFSAGSMTPNDIREVLHLNPDPDGGTLFVPANMRPIDEPFQAPADPASSPSLPNGPGSSGGANAQLRAIAVESSSRVLRKEQAMLRKAAAKAPSGGTDFEAEVRKFYDEHAGLVSAVMQVDSGVASAYASAQMTDVLAGGLAAAEKWTPDYLVALALQKPTRAKARKRPTPASAGART